jgi:hypothetical protein
VQYQGTGSIYLDLPTRPASAGTARVLDAAGGVLQSSATTALDSVNTTVNGAVSAGASQFNVTSATGITAGRRYLVDGSESAGGEFVLVSSVSSNTVHLARRLGRSQAHGAAFSGTRVTVTISTASTAACARGLRVEWTDPTSGAVLAVPFDVTRYAPQTWLTVQDLLDHDPILRKRLAEGAWLPAMRDRAWEILLDDIATKDRHPGGYAGHIDLTTAHSYLVRALVAETSGQDADSVAYRDDMRVQYRNALERALASVPYDEKEDGTTRVGTSVWRGIPFVRG